MPGGRAQRLAGLLPVVRQEGGLLVELRRVDRLDGARHRCVDLPPALAELRAVRHLLGQRMLEGIHGVRIERLLVDELRCHERPERGRELRFRQLAHAREHQLGELPPDHGRGLEDPLLALGQTVNPSRENRLHVRRDGEGVDRAQEIVSTALAADRPALDERLHHLLGEEGISRRALADQGAERLQRLGRPEQIAKELRGRLGAERQEGKLLVVNALHPGGVVLGTEVQEEQRPRPGRRLDRHLDERLAGGIEPVEVLDQPNGRLPAAPRLHDALDDGEEQALPGLGLHAGRGTFRIGNAVEVEHEREAVAQPLVEEEQLSRDLLAGGLRAVVVRHTMNVAQQLQHGQQRDRLAVRDPVPFVHGNTPGARALRELPAEAALADPGLRDDPEHLALPGNGAAERRLERGELVGTPDEAREAARA